MAVRTFTRSFRTSSLDAHAVLAFRAEQRLGRPTEASVTVQLADYVDPEELIGTPAELAFAAGDDGPLRRFGGIIEAVTIIGSTMIGGAAFITSSSTSSPRLASSPAAKARRSSRSSTSRRSSPRS